MALRTITWRTDYAKNNGEKLRGLVGEYELFAIEKHQFKKYTDDQFLLIIRLGRIIRFRGETIQELKDFSERYYEGFLKTIGAKQ